MVSCSGLRPRLCAPSPLIPSTWVLRSAFYAILHTWGQNLLHHPHLHCVVPGGGISPQGEWVSCLPGFFLPVRVLSRLFRRLFLEKLQLAFDRGKLQFHGDWTHFQHRDAFVSHLRPLAEMDWVVY